MKKVNFRHEKLMDKISFNEKNTQEKKLNMKGLRKSMVPLKN